MNRSLSLLLLLTPFWLFSSQIALATTINFVGDQINTAGQWRSTSLTKPLDADGDNVFGTAGYVLYAADVTPNSNSGNVPSAVNPLNYSSGTVATRISIPSWVTLTNSGQNAVAYSFGYSPMDDPTLLPSSVVADLESGLAARVGVSATDSTTFFTMLSFTINLGSPSSGFRLGIITDNTPSDTPSGIQLAGTGFNTVTQVLSASDSNGDPDIYLFDVMDSDPGDTFTLSLRRSTANLNPNVAYVGLTIDVLPVPEPSTLTLCAIGTLGAILFAARRNCHVVDTAGNMRSQSA